MTSLQQAYDDVHKFNDIAGNLSNVNIKSIFAQLKFIQEELTEGVEAVLDGDSVELLDSACDMFVTVVGFMQKLEAIGFNVEEALKRVNDNNLSKFPTEVPTASLVDGYTYSVNESYGVYVIKDKNDKIRKPSDFKSVYLGDLVPKGLFK